MPPLPHRQEEMRGRRPAPFTGVMRIARTVSDLSPPVGEWAPLTLAFRVPHVGVHLRNGGWTKGDNVLILSADGNAAPRAAVITKIVGESICFEYEDVDAQDGLGEDGGTRRRSVLSGSEAKSRLVMRSGSEGTASSLPRPFVASCRTEKTAVMLLDTGMGGREAFQINVDRARHLSGVDAGRLGRFVGEASAGPVKPGERLVIERFRIGGATVEEAEIEATDADTDKLSVSCGVCGIAAFAGRRVVFDYSNHRLFVGSKLPAGDRN